MTQLALPGRIRKATDSNEAKEMEAHTIPPRFITGSNPQTGKDYKKEFSHIINKQKTGKSTILLELIRITSNVKTFENGNFGMN
eukprot:5953424-Amphidinium_carterae.1